MIEISPGQIIIETRNIPHNELKRIEQIILILITKGAFEVKNGKTILQWDKEGNLKEINIFVKKFDKVFEKSYNKEN